MVHHLVVVWTTRFPRVLVAAARISASAAPRQHAHCLGQCRSLAEIWKRYLLGIYAPFGSEPGHALSYLALYGRRLAIANARSWCSGCIGERVSQGGSRLPPHLASLIEFVTARLS